jgi:methylaspartate ammonia-lyase
MSRSGSRCVYGLLGSSVGLWSGRLKNNARSLRQERLTTKLHIEMPAFYGSAVTEGHLMAKSQALIIDFGLECCKISCYEQLEPTGTAMVSGPTDV